MTRPKLPISGPITSPARCLNCGMRTFAYLGDPLAATGLWKCSGCKWRQIGVRPAYDERPEPEPEPEPPIIEPQSSELHPKLLAAMVACKAHPNCFDRIPRSTNNPSFSRNRLHVQDRRRVYFHLRESERMSFPEISLITTGVKGKHSTIFEGIEALVTEVSRETEQARV